MGSFSSNIKQCMKGRKYCTFKKKALVKYAAILVNLWKFCISAGCVKNYGQFFYIIKRLPGPDTFQICVENIGEKPMLQL
jgi:hypothetical protein